MDRMSKGERDDLLRLIRQRERVSKTGAEQRSAALLAEFESQISAEYGFDQDEVWKAAAEAGKAAIDDANAKVAERCRELGIPQQFQPRLHVAWSSRGENETKSRREELRRLAKAEIAALEKTARANIEIESVNAQTEILANGLSSDAANVFLEKLGDVDRLMPTLSLSKIENKLLEKKTANPYGYLQ